MAGMVSLWAMPGGAWCRLVAQAMQEAGPCPSKFAYADGPGLLNRLNLQDSLLCDLPAILQLTGTHCRAPLPRTPPGLTFQDSLDYTHVCLPGGVCTCAPQTAAARRGAEALLLSALTTLIAHACALVCAIGDAVGGGAAQAPAGAP